MSEERDQPVALWQRMGCTVYLRLAAIVSIFAVAHCSYIRTVSVGRKHSYVDRRSHSAEYGAELQSSGGGG